MPDRSVKRRGLRHRDNAGDRSARLRRRETDAEGVDALARYRAGDAEAFDQLVADFEPRLLQYFYRLCWDRDRAEDLTQSLFLKLLRSSGSYTPQGRLATFVFRVATNLWIDEYRQQGGGKRRLYSLDQAISGGFEPAGPSDRPSPAEQAERAEDKVRLRQALEQLTEPHRLVFELAVYQELPYAEVGAILDIPVGTVKSRMHNSVRALREIMAAEAPAEGTSFRAGRDGACRKTREGRIA